MIIRNIVAPCFFETPAFGAKRVMQAAFDKDLTSGDHLIEGKVQKLIGDVVNISIADQIWKQTMHTLYAI